MRTAAVWAFWLSVVYLCYVYAGFPALVAVVGTL